MAKIYFRVLNDDGSIARTEERSRAFAEGLVRDTQSMFNDVWCESEYIRDTGEIGFEIVGIKSNMLMKQLISALEASSKAMDSGRIEWRRG